MLSKIFESLFVVLADSIASSLTFEFVDELKERLTYEINLIQNLDIRSDLSLMFDSSEISSKLLKMVQIYSENLNYKLKNYQGDDMNFEEHQRDASVYFEGIKSILTFYASEDCMDSFGENNTSLIQNVLQNPNISNSCDLIIFLHLVVKADLANESEVEGEDARTRQLRIKKSRYGKLTNINKFSISHIEWLEEAMPQVSGLF